MSEAPTTAPGKHPGTNPYLVTLFAGASVLILVGLILAGVGGNYDPSPYRDSNIPIWLGPFGGVLLQIGIVALLLGFTAGAVSWAMGNRSQFWK